MTSHSIFVIQKGVVSHIPLGLSDAPKHIKRDHTTFLKITLPSPPTGYTNWCVDTDGFRMIAARQDFQLLFRHDPKLVCYPYPKKRRANIKMPVVLQETVLAALLQEGLVQP